MVLFGYRKFQGQSVRGTCQLVSLHWELKTAYLFIALLQQSLRPSFLLIG